MFFLPCRSPCRICPQHHRISFQVPESSSLCSRSKAFLLCPHGPGLRLDRPASTHGHGTAEHVLVSLGLGYAGQGEQQPPPRSERRPQSTSSSPWISGLKLEGNREYTENSLSQLEPNIAVKDGQRWSRMVIKCQIDTKQLR